MPAPGRFGGTSARAFRGPFAFTANLPFHNSSTAMASNAFLPTGTTTELTVLFDTPKEGLSQYGPYRAYRVSTPDGEQHTFFPPRSLFPELDRLQIRRGSKLHVRASERISPDGRVVPRIEIVGGTEPNTEAPPAGERGPVRQRGGSQDSILACVALKAAVQARGPLDAPEDALALAERFLGWLRSRNE